MSASNIQLVKVVFKLLPAVISFRKDRRDWVKREGKNINKKKYTKHAEKALKVFIALGPSYIKLGQWLSTRADFLPQPYLEVLSKLQDDVPPAPFTQVKPIIESELGQLKIHLNGLIHLHFPVQVLVKYILLSITGRKLLSR